MDSPLAFEDFAGTIVREVAPGYQGPVNADTALFEEVGLDSLSALNMLVLIEELADLPFGPEWPSIFTMGEAFDYYIECCGLASEFAS